MKLKLISLAIAMIATFPVSSAYAAEKGKAKSDAKPAESKPADDKSEAKPKRDTYPLYGKVVAITSRTLTIVRSNADDAKQSKYTINSATEIVNGDKAATVDDVKVGKWIGGSLKKAEGDGNDIVLKINIAAKQKEEGEAKGKGESKSSKKAATK